MNVLTIVETWLRQNGFDGLVEPDAICSCKMGHLAPCGQIGHNCIPGHIAPCPPECGEGCGFHIVGVHSGWSVEGHPEWSTLDNQAKDKQSLALVTIRTLASEWLDASDLNNIDLVQIVKICKKAQQ